MRRAALLGAGLLWATAASAGEGRIPIPFQAPMGFPIVISTPGKYVLTRDLVGPGGVAVLEIAATDVEIDLNGKVISGGEPGIRITLLAEAVIRNGAIEGGEIGILGVTGLNDVTIENVRFSDITLQAVLLNDPDTYVIRRCIVEDVTGLVPSDGAIQITAGANSHGTIEANVVRRVSGDGISVESSPAVVVRDNRIKEITGIGISISGETAGGALVSENTVQDCESNGIFLASDGSKLINNLVLDSGSVGISFGRTGNLILDNVVSGSSSHGIYLSVGSGNRIHGNVATSNGTGGAGFGLFLSFGATENTFGRNTAFGNAGVTACAAPRGDDYCEDRATPSNYSFGDNLMPPSLGLF